MFKKFLSFPNHSIRVCVKGKKTNRGVGCGLEIPAEYFMAMRKLFNGQKENLMVFVGMWKKKVLRCLK